MPPSPPRDPLAHPAHNFVQSQAKTTELLPPPSPRTHRLRKLQSAHNLGSKAALQLQPLHQPSLISQQRLTQITQRNISPTRRDPSSSSNVARHTRGRSNSDAPAPVIHHINALATGKRSMMGISPKYATMSLQQLIKEGPPEGDKIEALGMARRKILSEGVKSDSDGMSTLRIYVWLILLDTPVLPTDDYLGLIHRGASPAYSKIRNDTFRTLTTDPLFRRRVSEASLIRLLNAVAWRLHDAREEQRRERPSTGRSSISQDSSTSTSTATAYSQDPAFSPGARNRARALTLTTEGSESSHAAEPGTYVQGMNVLAAPFLYAARSESEAFIAFYTLLTRECPGYIRGAMDGVHKGLALVDKVLATVDSKLSGYLHSKGLTAEIYAFPSVLTLCACTPPLPEVLRLWDFLFAYGPHLNILCIVAQLMGMRDQLMSSPSPNKLLRSFPSLQADKVIERTLWIVERIPDDTYVAIVAHAH
ncbi:TBC domain-containing protein [Colletotrichum phormii]|uniref:TBC domain-containing protein n=2 Tax=Colletotrichum acutatum species complex TaxID=2707335 RepID=A0AAJ0A8W0_9PEZI|nr:TBC domain-containing protein [Colletotrichum godetiae]XP_060447653.1 TBC domain-containing protein [Colletotrichum phormii]KAK1639046.1 TBC domain-containing protein [Colletotrichum phormii]KAK1658632.1 TBC domain-containing protein [Colletotrichum godetiae]